ncbi:MAG: hypothetical protein GPJ54_07055 [Candidatus Heimdallarchaeota archaeon]|nr:hypothetical protein [Candidatus Heimdallarchaeota archaeon]
MKVLIPASEIKPNPGSTPNRLMGTSRAFLIYNTESNSYSSLNNVYIDKEECHLSRDLAELGITDIIATKICDPCYGNLKKVGIEIWKDDNSVTIREAYQKFQMGGLFLMTESGNCTCPKHKIMELREREKLKKYV